MRRRIIIALIVAAGAYLRLHDLGWGLPEFFEEATPWRQAWEMWGFEGGRLDFNPHFFHYPALSFYIQWLGQAMIYLVGRVSGEFASIHQMQAAFQASPDRFIVVGRLITALFGIGSIYLVYRIGRDLYSPLAGGLAALFLAFNLSSISRGRLITTDTPLVFFVLLAFVPIIMIARRGSRGDYIRAGICVGLAAGVKYPGILAGSGIVAAHAYFHLAHRHTLKRTILDSSIWASAAAALLAFFAVSPYCFLNYSGFLKDFRFEQTHMAVGHFGAPERLVSYGHYLFSVIPQVLTLPILAFTLAGIGYGVRKDRDATLFLLAFPLVYFMVVGSWKAAADHYMLPILPFLMLFAALPLWKVYSRLRFPGRAPVLAIAAGLLVLPSALQIQNSRSAASMEDNRTLARTWIEANIEKGAAIAKESITPDLEGDDYLVFELPLSTIYPEETGPFYDLRLYRDFDYMITSSQVRSRYLKHPAEFPVQARFYRDLEENTALVRQFDRATGTGPGISIYHLSFRPDTEGYGAVLADMRARLVASPDPEANARTLCNLAIVLSRKNRQSSAIELYGLALAMDSTMVGAWHNLGLTLESQGRTGEAGRALERAVELDSTYAGSWIALGHLYRKSGDQAAALRAYERGLRYDPYNLDVLRILSELYLRMGRTDDALRLAERGLEASRGSAEFHFAAGCIYMVREDFKSAVRELNSAVDARPQDGRYAYSLAGAYYSTGDYSSAMRYARRAQQLGFDASDLIGMIEAASPGNE